MADAPFSITEGDVFIPEIWSPQLLAAMQKNLVMANLTVDRSAELAPNGDTLKIPSFAGLTALQKAVKTPTVLQQPTTDSLTLSVNQHWYVDVLVEDSLNAVSKYNMVQEFVTDGAYQVAKKFDSSLLALYATAGSSVDLSTDTASADVYAHLLEPLEALNIADAPETDRAFVIHPKMLTRLLKVDPLISALYNAGGAPAVNGKVSQFLGAQIFVTTNVPRTGASGSYTYHNMYFHKQAMCFAVKLGPRTQFQYLLQNRGTVAAADMFWGVLLQRPTWAVEVKNTETT